MPVLYENAVIPATLGLIVTEKKKSTHKAEVVRIHIEKHPNADKLGVVKVFGGYTVCVGLDHWAEGQLAVYLVPDTLVDTRRPEFSSFAEDCKPGDPWYRVQAKKLRGVPSFGMLIPAPEGANEGDDLFVELGLQHYEPPTPAITGGDEEKGPEWFIPKYDVDALKRYSDKFVAGETVVLTEKIHGANGRWTWHEGRMYAGSKEAWKQENPSSIWWKVLQSTPQIVDYCKAKPDHVLYGEVYGAVQDLKYGCKQGEVKAAIFDVWDKANNRWLNMCDANDCADLAHFNVPAVPLVAVIPFDLDKVVEYAEGKSLVEGAEDQIREGIVVQPVKPRTDLEIGRVILKVVGLGYLSRRQKQNAA
jgi:RNA ligase (TIGR02306 family)